MGDLGGQINQIHLLMLQVSTSPLTNFNTGVKLITLGCTINIFAPKEPLGIRLPVSQLAEIRLTVQTVGT